MTWSLSKFEEKCTESCLLVLLSNFRRIEISQHVVWMSTGFRKCLNICQLYNLWGPISLHTYQCFCFSRNIGYVTLKIIYFYYPKCVWIGSKYPKSVWLKFENRTTALCCAQDSEAFTIVVHVHVCVLPVMCLYGVHRLYCMAAKHSNNHMFWSKIQNDSMQKVMSRCWQQQDNCNPSFGFSIGCRMATLHDFACLNVQRAWDFSSDFVF